MDRPHHRAPAFAGVVPLLLSLPPVIGHRGAAAYAPENTLTAFRVARSRGCTLVEFDVRLTADDALVICHDDRLARTSDGHGVISRMPLDAIRHCDAGGWFSDKFAGERIPTLEEALGLCREIGLGANVEIKAEDGRGPATAGAIAACLDDLYGRLPPVLISSFLPDAVAEAAVQAPGIPRGMLWRKIPRGWAAIAGRLGCATIHVGQADLTESDVAQVSGAGYPLLAYTVNDPDRARQLFDWGVTSVFSDTPDIIIAATGCSETGAQRGVRL
jgi:glycerophosphoryl diester phosphodiesterase